MKKPRLGEVRGPAQPAQLRSSHQTGLLFAEDRHTCQALCFHQRPHEMGLLVSPGDRGGNGGSEWLGHKPKVTQLE